jgi:uncharacterized ferritin-like protein (DUF455 family)
MTTIAVAAREVLATADPLQKVRCARRVAREWRGGRIDHAFDVAMPDVPARPARPTLVAPKCMPKRGRGGSERGRIAMLHAIAHIEFVAIDLAFDMVGRFGGAFPRAFTDDFVAIGAQEAMHFALVRRRLVAHGSDYGALPAHDGLWEAASATAHDAPARIAVVPMVLEARGLDVTPAMQARFAAAGDHRSASVLQRILTDEIAHVNAGVRWFESHCVARGIAAAPLWQLLVRTYFGGAIKPPFNASARDAAGLTLDFYGALAPADMLQHGTGTVVAGWASS